MTTYQIPTNVTDLARVSARLATAEHKASKLRAIHELATYCAWKAELIEGVAASATGADFATLLGRSAGHVSKLAGIVNSTNTLVAGVLSGLIEQKADAADMLAVVTAKVGEIDTAAHNDETAPRYCGKGAATVDAIYGYLGVGKTGGETTWQTVLARSVKMAKADQVGRQRFLLEVESLLG